MIPCKNPQHPDGTSKFTMVLVQDKPTEEVWACKACMDINRVYSIQVKTKRKYQQHVRGELRKQGRLPSRPQTAPMPKFYK
jgi:hypothetical protein